MLQQALPCSRRNSEQEASHCESPRGSIHESQQCDPAVSGWQCAAIFQRSKHWGRRNRREALQQQDLELAGQKAKVDKVEMRRATWLKSCGDIPPLKRVGRR